MRKGNAQESVGDASGRTGPGTTKEAAAKGNEFTRIVRVKIMATRALGNLGRAGQMTKSEGHVGRDRRRYVVDVVRMIGDRVTRRKTKKVMGMVTLMNGLGWLRREWMIYRRLEGVV